MLSSKGQQLRSVLGDYSSLGKLHMGTSGALNCTRPQEVSPDVSQLPDSRFGEGEWFRIIDDASAYILIYPRKVCLRD